MKKILTLLCICVATLSAYAQDYKNSDYYYYDGIENYNGISITPEQKEKIITIKQGIGLRHAAIGNNRNLTGYQKGEAHRELNKQIRAEIYDILNPDQRTKWDNEGRTAWINQLAVIENQIDKLDHEIDDLEDYYDDLIDDVEDNDSLSKSEQKAKKEALKQEFKIKKAELKEKKQNLKESRFYKE